MATCSVPSCPRPVLARTWCGMHYQRWTKYGDPLAATPRRTWGWEHKSTVHASTKPSQRDLAWAAGFLEGEGSFGWNSGGKIGAVQINQEPVQRMLALFGGALRIYRQQPRRIWEWYATGSRARGIAMTLYPWMSAKRQGQIRKVVCSQES